MVADEQPINLYQLIIHLRIVVVSLSPGGLGDGVSLRVVAGFVSEIGDGHRLAVLIGVAVGAADNHDVVGLVLLIQSFLHCTLLLADDTLSGLEIKVVGTLGLLIVVGPDDRFGLLNGGSGDDVLVISISHVARPQARDLRGVVQNAELRAVHLASTATQPTPFDPPPRALLSVTRCFADGVRRSFRW